MPVEMVARLRHTDEPVNGSQSLVRLGIVIVNAKGRRVRNENVQGAPIVDPVQPQPRKHAERPEIRFGLRMLVCPVRTVEHRAAETPDQKFPKPDQFQVQVGAAFDTGEMIVRVVVRVMVAGHIEQWNIQHRQQVFKVRIRQVSTAEDQIDLAKVTRCT